MSELTWQILQLKGLLESLSQLTVSSLSKQNYSTWEVEQLKQDRWRMETTAVLSALQSK